MHMTVSTKAKKTSVNLSINADLLAEAKALGINLSALCEAALEVEVKRLREAKWLEENREAMDAYNAVVREHGLFGDTFRRF